MTVMPKTKLGRWTVGLLAVFCIAFIAMQLMVKFGQTGGETFSDNLFSNNSLLVIVGVIGDVSALVAGPLGTVSILKLKERSWLVFLAIPVSFLVLIYLLDIIRA